MQAKKVMCCPLYFFCGDTFFYEGILVNTMCVLPQKGDDDFIQVYLRCWR
jgi:hypothetical protein